MSKKDEHIEKLQALVSAQERQLSVTGSMLKTTEENLQYTRGVNADYHRVLSDIAGGTFSGRTVDGADVRKRLSRKDMMRKAKVVLWQT
jgi:hypothetical protein